MEIPTGPQALTAAWLTDALRKDGTVRQAGVTDHDDGFQLVAEATQEFFLGF